MAPRRSRSGVAAGAGQPAAADRSADDAAVLVADVERGVRESFSSQALLGTIGAWLVSATPGKIVLELPYSQRIAADPGHFHSAVVGALGDAAAVHAAMTVLPAASRVETIEYKVNFVRPAVGALLRAEGVVVRTAGALVTLRTDVTILGGVGDGVCAVLLTTAMRHGR